MRPPCLWASWERALGYLFEGTFDEEIGVERIPSLPIAFRLWVSNHAITKGTWPVIGSRPLLPENAEEPFFYKQDAISGRLSLYHSAFAATNYERSASLDECQHLECAAVWEPEHVVDRLNDHAAHRPNRWVESLRINATAIPA
ncbi:Imm26 family immunity protein [Sandaracinobacteroides hominis]|uniref:Imm26 family immunity protein n=1 Tax=Sandaracinobacteroides hominis TaxID=2780086 RepID=UPI0018F30D5B